MAQTGRKPYETTDLVPFGAGNHRLRPPESLSGAQRVAFVDLVTSCPATQFEPADIPLLARWAELSTMAEMAAVELQASGLLAPDGKPSPWFRIHLEATKALSGLALRLRLGPQSRAPRAPKTKTTTVSYYERMTLEGISRDDASEGDDSEPEA
jgi:hypothetical protein